MVGPLNTMSMRQRIWPWAGPSRRTLVLLVLGALLLHVVLLWGLSSPLALRLSAAPSVSPVQVRVVPLMPQAPAVDRPAPVAARPAALPQVGRPAASPLPGPAEAAAEAGPDPAPDPASAAAPLPEASEAAQSLSQTLQEAAAPLAMPQPASALAPPATSSEAAWPLISLGALPPSQLMHYQLHGMDKGLSYHANGELRWQHNDTAYELSLTVRAFLVGRRQWRSVGQIDATGLAPRRFSDSWRNERAAHFDREQQRVVFSSNSTPAPLQPGAQDQVSLYVQLAAAMAGEPERFAPGTRLQVQTATVRDALPWSLVLAGTETLALEGQSLNVSKWVCQPRNLYEARVEFWVAAAQSWMPVRIRITQVSGSFIDLLWRSTEPLPPLPVSGDTKTLPRPS